MNGWERAGSTTWRPSTSKDGWKKIRREVKDDLLVLCWSSGTTCHHLWILQVQSAHFQKCWQPGRMRDQEFDMMKKSDIFQLDVSYGATLSLKSCSSYVRSSVGHFYRHPAQLLFYSLSSFLKSKPVKTFPRDIHTVIGQSFPMSSNSAPYKRSFNTYLCNSTYVYYWKHDIQRMRDQEFDVNSDPC